MSNAFLNMSNFLCVASNNSLCLPTVLCPHPETSSFPKHTSAKENSVSLTTLLCVRLSLWAAPHSAVDRYTSLFSGSQWHTGASL